MKNRQQFIAELARIVGYQPEAEALLEEIQFPRGLMPIWQNFTNPTGYWTNVVTNIENGRLKDRGLERLAGAALAQFPGNRIFREAAEHEPAPLAAPTVTVTAPGDQAGPQRIEQWPTLILQGTDQYGAFLRLVRETVGPAELLYTTGEQAAVLVRGIDADGVDPPQVVARLQRAVDQLDLPDDAQVTVRFERYAYRPHLIEQLTLIGPDQQIFYVDNIPNTTPVRDIPQALFAMYREETRTDRLGRARRAVVDRVRPAQTAGGEAQRDRLGPDRTLEEAGVTERDELHVLPESTAGRAIDQVRLDALKRVHNEIEEFADASASGFRILDKDDPYLPTVYEVEFHARSFGPPDDLTVAPEELKPPERDVHRALIILSDAFPFKAPQVVIYSPIFHPNVLPAPRGPLPAGWVCIGALGDESFRPDLDFYLLCQLIIDIAAYRNYGAIQHGVWDEHGFLNRPAALWAQSNQGQEQILARGGRPILAMLGVEVGPPSGRILIRRSSEERQ
jgi:ubiquitin-protein ligase